MNTDEINWILSRNVGHKFLGVFSADQFPELRNFPCCYVINTDPAHLPGKHWVAYYHSSPNSHEFFDSYGQHPSSYLLSSYSNLTYNQKLLQSFTSNVCGQFCIYYLYRRCHFTSLSRIVSFLSKLSDPDRFVCTFVCNLDIHLPRNYCTRNCQCSCPRK